MFIYVSNSPEGAERLNKNLANTRFRSAKSFFEKDLKLQNTPMARNPKFVVQQTVTENWNGLYMLLGDSNIKNKDQIIKDLKGLRLQAGNMKRKIACVLLAAISLQLLSCGQHDSNETLTEPNYVLQEYETTKSENGYSIVNDFMVYDEPSPSGLYVYYPYVEEKKKGVSYLDDMYIRGNSARDEELQGEARPDGTSSKLGNSACDSMIVNAWSTPDFALKYNSDSSKGVGDERVGFAFSYLINDGDKEYKSGDDAMADVDVAAYSFALYEDFKDYGGPVCTVEIYGVPQALFKEKLGKKFNSDKLYDFLDKLKKDNYKSCELLATKRITETDVYYIDYSEFSKKGQYGNYVIKYTFSEKPRYNWVNTVKVGCYNINDEAKYTSWKREHAEKMIN